MKIYIAGRITGDQGYREKFAEAEKKLLCQGHLVMNPARLPDGFAHEDYMQICFAMIGVCDIVYLLPCWKMSPGAVREKEYAVKAKKLLCFAEEGV